MSWSPPYLAKPNCAQCLNRKTDGLELDGVVIATLQSCHLDSERRYWFRKNPPKPDMGNNGAQCKRYHPVMAAKFPQAEDWVEFPPQPISVTR